MSSLIDETTQSAIVLGFAFGFILMAILTAVIGESVIIPGVMGGFALIAAGLAVFLASASPASSSSTRREKLRRNSDYTEVIAESPDGYGTAVRDSDGGVSIVSFSDDDEIYQDTWVPGSDLDALADAVSVRACEKEREQDE